MKTDHLVNKARKAATLWLECDDALSEVEETYGTPWEAARQTLTSALTIADGDGVDLEQYQGPDSLFKFPEMGTMVMVRIVCRSLPMNSSALTSASRNSSGSFVWLRTSARLT